VFRNLLVVIDGSASATDALAPAIEMARVSGARLGLLSVAATPARGIPLALPPFALPASQPRLAVQLEADAQRRLDEAERRVPAEVPVTKLLSHGSVADALLEAVRSGPWDLVVIGHRRRAGRWPRPDDVGAHLLRAASVPVLVVPSPTPPAPESLARSRAASWRHTRSAPR
jgi:nucleotide-binding universal stress UspA family protein